MSQYDIIIMFATHNGGQYVEDVLDSYVAQKEPGVRWKIVAVNNASTDNTMAVLQSYRDKLPIEILYQPTAGKNRSLNYGLKDKSADLFIFTDDDAIPNSNFVREWATLLNHHLEFEIFGGTICPRFWSSPPKWLTEANLPFDVLYAQNKRLSGPVDAQHIYGPNMAVRGSVFQRGFSFNEQIGPNGAEKMYAMGSETEFCTRVESAGARAYFYSTAVVEHIVRPSQMTLEFIAGRANRNGRGFARRAIISKKVPVGFKLQGRRKVRHEVGRIIRKNWRLCPITKLRYKLLWDLNWSDGYYGELSLQE